MSRRRPLRALLPLAVLVTLLAVGCSDDGDKSDKGQASTTTETAPAEKAERRGRSGKGAKERSGRRKKGATAGKRVSKAELEKERRALRSEAARDRKEDREFDKGFRETPFEKIVGGLPVRKPPLFVEQYITESGRSTVYTAVAPKRFFCGRSAARRKAAVSSFYRDADKLFRRRGVEDFVQVVTPIAETTERLPALAIGRNGKVSLTERGRGKGPC